MPEEKTNVVEQQPADIVNQKGESIDVETTPLHGIFNKIETAKSEGKSAEEGLSDAGGDKQQTGERVRDENGRFKPAEKPVVEPADKEQKSAVEPKDDKDPKAALQKLLEDDKPAKAVEKKPVDDKQADDEQDVPADELKPLPHDSERVKRRIKTLLAKVEKAESVVTTTKADAETKAQKLAELEKKLTDTKSVDPKTQEEIKTLRDQLAMYRRRYDLDNDPEVKTKFDDRVTSAEQGIIDTLKRRGASDAMLAIIKEEGGWAKFSASARQIPIPDGDGGVKNLSAAEVADLILSNLALGDRKAVEASMVEQFATRRDKERFYKEQQDTATAYFQKLEEDSKKQAQDQQKQVEQAGQAVVEWRTKLDASDWLKDKELPEGATPEQKAEVSRYNAYNAKLRELADTTIQTAKDLPSLLDVVQNSIRYFDELRTSSILRKENERLGAEVKAKDEEIKKFKNGGRSVSRGGSIAPTASPAASASSDKPGSLREAFDRIQQGENLGEIITSNE